MNSPQRRFFIPEVIQSSMMDCGPAALKAVIEGFGGHASYGRLREACHTDVDGTSIETIEALAQQLGLDTAQLLVPNEHLLLPQADALPAIAVVTQPNGMAHFIVLWSMVGQWVQIMDPGTGRHWIKRQDLQQRLYRHQHGVDKQVWFEWAESADFIPLLLSRLLAICLDDNWAQACVSQAINSGDWQKIAIVDAAVTMTGDLIGSGGVTKGEDAGLLVNNLIQNNN